MRYLITIIVPGGRITYSAIGDRDALMDAAYDDGAMGVSIVVQE